MIEDQILEISPLAYMRGRTFKNSWIIADEMQSATPAQGKMLLTRIGINSKIVITGDADQSDIKHGNNALVDLCERLQKGGGIKGLVVCLFENRDIQRHPIISKILEIYKD
jgi:phosphate starvation-inducible PhoH-like protein